MPPASGASRAQAQTARFMSSMGSVVAATVHKLMFDSHWCSGFNV